jgi:hypothetical protein
MPCRTISIYRLSLVSLREAKFYPKYLCCFRYIVKAVVFSPTAIDMQ